MNKSVKVALGQINPTIADIVGNTKLVIDCLNQSRGKSIDIMAFPEMAIIGYPAQDLLFRAELIEANVRALDVIVPHTAEYPVVVVGYCHPASDVSEWRIDRQHLYNAYAVFSYGRLLGWGAKSCLPCYGVFDDYRYFIPYPDTKIFEVNGIRLGVEICEDLWYRNHEQHPVYPIKPTQSLTDKGADIILVLNASPYHLYKEKEREDLVTGQSRDNHVPIFYVNMWGGNDKIIFDGSSLASDAYGNVIVRGKSFMDDIVICDIDLANQLAVGIPAIPFVEEEMLYQALVMGKRDYHKKCGIKGSVIGVSGGIDSAIVLAIDVAAIGSDNVLAIISPSRYTSQGTLRDAIALCENFGVSYRLIAIEERDSAGEWCGVIPEKVKRYIQHMGEPRNEVVFENQQAIDRMSILRAIANEESRLVSGTGNKSELAMGYATVCGDLQADILVIGDLYKRQVYSLAKYINKIADSMMIPESIITRKPSAELSTDQVDPFDYHRLDELLRLKVECYVSDEELESYAPEGQAPFTKEEISNYSRLIDQTEHKRFKSGYILKISPVAFGEDRRINTAKHVTLWDKGENPMV